MSTAEDQIAAEMTPDEDDENDAAENDEQPADPGEGTDAPEEAAPPPRSQKEIDELTKKLEAEAQRHAKRVAELMGDDFSLLVPNPTDWTPGFLFNVPEMLPSQEAVAEFDAILGRARGEEYQVADDAERCEKCKGIGDVLTGSRKEGQITKQCRHCTGAGWVTKAAPLQLAPSPAYDQNGAAQTVSQPNQFQVADRWGRPFGHVHYGLEPALVSA